MKLVQVGFWSGLVSLAGIGAVYQYNQIERERDVLVVKRNLKLLQEKLKKVEQQQQKEHALYHNSYNYEPYYDIYPQHRQIFEDGLPSDANIGVTESYVCSQNYERKIPNWVIHEVTAEEMDKERVADRSHSHFNNRSLNVPTHLRVSNYDYIGSGYSRGHMCPAGDCIKKSQKAMDDTFLLNSNIVPQEYNNNANYWYRMELLCRDKLPTKFDKVRIISGPMFTSEEEEEEDNTSSDKQNSYRRKKPKKYVKYQVIGKNNVAVPPFLFKVIMCENDNAHLTGDRQVHVAAFAVPNTPIAKEKPLSDFQVPLEMIETQCGMSIFPNIPKANRYDLCREDPENCSLLSGNDWEIYNTVRRLGWADTVEQLDKTFNNFKEQSDLVPKKVQEKYDTLRQKLVLSNNLKRNMESVAANQDENF